VECKVRHKGGGGGGRREGMEGGLWLWGGEHHCSVWNGSEERGGQGQRAGA